MYIGIEIEIDLCEITYSTLSNVFKYMLRYGVRLTSACAQWIFSGIRDLNRWIWVLLSCRISEKLDCRICFATGILHNQNVTPHTVYVLPNDVLGVQIRKDAKCLQIQDPREIVRNTNLILSQDDVIIEYYYWGYCFFFQSWEALPPDTATFTPDITPLILSAHRDNYEIIKILLDRGATLPMPHDVRWVNTKLFSISIPINLFFFIKFDMKSWKMALQR